MLCNYLQNVAAITYIFVLQLSTFLFYNKQNSCAKIESRKQTLEKRRHLISRIVLYPANLVPLRFEGAGAGLLRDLFSARRPFPSEQERFVKQP